MKVAKMIKYLAFPNVNYDYFVEDVDYFIDL